MDSPKPPRFASAPNSQIRAIESVGEVRRQLEIAKANPIREQIERIVDPCGISKLVEEASARYAPPSALEQFYEQLRIQQEQREKILSVGSEWERTIRGIIDPIRTIATKVQAYLDATGPDWVHLLEQCRRHIEQLPDEIGDQVTILIERGWCLDPDMASSWLRDLVAAILDGEEDTAEQALINHFRGQLDTIEASLTAMHSERSTILEEAFKAHREGRYFLSIPVFLAQADGIVQHRLKRELYSRNTSKGLTGIAANLTDDELLAVYWYVFTNEADMPLNRRTTQLPPGFDGLNRHAVFHGLDIQYGTEVNSLRAISVLNFASYLLKKLPKTDTKAP